MGDQFYGIDRLHEVDGLELPRLGLEHWVAVVIKDNRRRRRKVAGQKGQVQTVEIAEANIADDNTWRMRFELLPGLCEAGGHGHPMSFTLERDGQ